MFRGYLWHVHVDEGKEVAVKQSLKRVQYSKHCLFFCRRREQLAIRYTNNFNCLTHSWFFLREIWWNLQDEGLNKRDAINGNKTILHQVTCTPGTLQGRVHLASFGLSFPLSGAAPRVITCPWKQVYTENFAHECVKEGIFLCESQTIKRSHFTGYVCRWFFYLVLLPSV